MLTSRSSSLPIDGVVFERSADGALPRWFSRDDRGPTEPGRIDFNVFGRCQRGSAFLRNATGWISVSTPGKSALIAGSIAPLSSIPFTFTLGCDGCACTARGLRRRPHP